MALQESIIPVPFAQGLDTKTDPKQVPVGRLSAIQNSTFQNPQELSKANGFAALNTNIVGGGNIAAGLGIAPFQSQLLLADGKTLYSYSASTANWSNKGALAVTGLTSTSILKNFYSQSSPDFAFNSAAKLSCYVWEDTQGGVRYSVIDTVTGNQIIDDSAISSTGINPRVATIGSVFVILYVDSNQIQFKSISTSTPQTLSGPTALTSNLNSTHQVFDTAVSNSKVFIGYTTSSPSIGFYSISAALSVSGNYTVGSDVETCISLTSDGSNNIWASYYTGTAVRTLIVNNALASTVLAPTTVETVASIRNITSLVTSTTATLWYEVQATNKYDENIRTNTVTLTGTVGTASVFIRSLGLASKAFSYNSTGYLLSTYSSSLQGKYFLLNSSGQAVMRLGGEPNLGGGLTAKSLLPSVWALSTGNYGIPFLQVDEISFSEVFDSSNVASEVASTQTGIQQAAITFSSQSPVSIELGENLNLSNGIPSIYDSNNIVEQGFNLYPENLQGGAEASNFIQMGTNISTAAEFLDHSATVGQMGNDLSDNSAVAQPFTPSVAGTSFSVAVYLQKVVGGGGTSAGSVTFSIWTNSSGAPGTQISNAAQVASASIPSFPTAASQFTLSFTSGAVSIGQSYFLVMDNRAYSGTNSVVNIGGNNNGTGGGTLIYPFAIAQAVGGSTWSHLSGGGGGASTNLYFIYDVSTATSEVAVGYNPLGGALSQGEYQYTTVYSWVDNQGQKHQSSPSPAYQMDSTGNLNQYNLQIIADISNSSTSVTSSNTHGLYPGLGLKSANLTATPETTVVSASSGSFVMNQNGASSNATALVTGKPQFQVTAITNNGSTLAQILPPEFMYIYGTSQNTNVILVDDSSTLQVGMSLQAADGSSSFPLSYITAISGNQVTLNQAVGSIIGQALQVSIQASVGTTSGGTTLTGVPSYLFPLLYVGQYVESTAFTATGQYFIASLNAGANTVDLSGPSNQTTGTYAAYFNLTASNFIQVGQMISDNIVNLPANTLINGVKDLGFGLAQVELSNAAIGTTAGSTVTISNTVEGVIKIPTLRVTNRTGPVNIDVYRTTNIGGVPGTVFFKSGTIQNDPTVDYVTYIDKTSDLQIVNNTQLYTEGGVVPNIAAPPHKLSCIYNNRQLIVPSESPNGFWYSQQVVPGSPVEFSDSFINNIDARNGDITSIGVMDDKLITFKQNAAFYQSAQGPSPNGNDNDFNSGIRINMDTGCSNQASIVEIPLGLIFQSPKGIYLLTRDLAGVYIGADVEAYNQYTVTSALLIPGQTRVRLSLSNGIYLEYDYYVKQWYTRGSVASVQSCIYNQEYTYVQSGGTVLYETPGVYTDNGVYIPQSLSTGWLSFAGVQGFQRLKSFLLLGTYYSPVTLTVQIAVNFDPTIVQTETITLTSDPGPLQERIWLINQKTETIKITITESSSTTSGQGYSLSGLSFVVGQKKGNWKLPASQDYGT